MNFKFIATDNYILIILASHGNEEKLHEYIPESLIFPKNTFINCIHVKSFTDKLILSLEYYIRQIFAQGCFCNLYFTHEEASQIIKDHSMNLKNHLSTNLSEDINIMRTYSKTLPLFKIYEIFNLVTEKITYNYLGSFQKVGPPLYLENGEDTKSYGAISKISNIWIGNLMIRCILSFDEHFTLTIMNKISKREINKYDDIKNEDIDDLFSMLLIEAHEYMGRSDSRAKIVGVKTGRKEEVLQAALIQEENIVIFPIKNEIGDIFVEYHFPKDYHRDKIKSFIGYN